jgi:hypothetical protein
VSGNLVINKMNVFGTGEYSLISQAGTGNNFHLDDIGYYHEQSRKTYLAISGKLTVTKLDTVNHIVSGRFYFTAKDSLGSKVEVTDGRFDAKYYH